MLPKPRKRRANGNRFVGGLVDRQVCVLDVQHIDRGSPGHGQQRHHPPKGGHGCRSKRLILLHVAGPLVLPGHQAGSTEPSCGALLPHFDKDGGKVLCRLICNLLEHPYPLESFDLGQLSFIIKAFDLLGGQLRREVAHFGCAVVAGCWLPGFTFPNQLPWVVAVVGLRHLKVHSLVPVGVDRLNQANLLAGLQLLLLRAAARLALRPGLPGIIISSPSGPFPLGTWPTCFSLHPRGAGVGHCQQLILGSAAAAAALGVRAGLVLHVVWHLCWWSRGAWLNPRQSWSRRGL